MTFLTAELDDFSPTGEGEAGAAITETTHAIAAAKLQRAVQRDIKEMLLRSKPYLQHTQAVAKVKLASLVILARPKPALLHPENALGFDDHTEYAKWKTGQLAAQRGVANHHREVNTRKLEDTQKRFQAYTDAKCQRKEKLKAEETAEAEAKQPHASASSVAYENSIKGHATGPRSSSGEAQGFLTLSKDLFTEDAWQGMSEMVRYASFIDSIEAEGVEERPGCEQCKENRQVLEKTWQVVANEYYDVNGRFSQREWAAQLLSALQESGGALRDKPQLTAAATKMIALLDDPYSEYLTPNRFRQALLRPSPVERDYLAAQSIGVGVKLGPLCAEGGRRVTAPLASSPAEGAGVVAGDRLLAVVGAAPVPPQAVLASLSTRQVSASSSASETGSRNGSSSGGNAGPNSNSSSSSSTGRTQNVSLTSTAGVSQTSPVASRSSQFPSRRSSDAAVTEIKIERRELPKPAVQTTQLQLPDGRTASYLRVNYISSAGTREVQRAVSNSATNGSAGFIIDLRNNPGQLSTFIFSDMEGAPSTKLPTVLLVNRSSASASEALLRVAPRQESWRPIDALPCPGAHDALRHPLLTLRAGRVVLLLHALGRGMPVRRAVKSCPRQRLKHTPSEMKTEGAPNRPTGSRDSRRSAHDSRPLSTVLAGALHDNGRALLIGEHTFGKGQIQYYFPLADDSGLKLTIAKYVTPARHDVSGEHGLEPDVVCRDFPHGGGGILRPVPVPRTALPLRLALSREAQVLSVRVWGGEAVAASALPSGNRQAQPSAASERQHWDSHGWLGPTWLVGLDWL
ncbi:MAG: hypothetical protein WDW38_000428 [Sanguina aurantia]